MIMTTTVESVTSCGCENSSDIKKMFVFCAQSVVIEFDRDDDDLSLHKTLPLSPSLFTCTHTSDRCSSGFRHVIDFLRLGFYPQHFADGDGFTFVSQGKPSQLRNVGKLFHAYWSSDGHSNDAN